MKADGDKWKKSWFIHFFKIPAHKITALMRFNKIKFVYLSKDNHIYCAPLDIRIFSQIQIILV